MTTILVVILSCMKNKALWPKILERGIPNLIILCGGAEETKLENQILNLKCVDGYEGLPAKMMYAIEFILKCEKFSSITHILKADDHDTNFSNADISNISSKYSNILNSNDYIGQNLIRSRGDRKYHYGKVSKGCSWDNKPYNGAFNPWLGGGETYILSKRAMTCVYSEIHNLAKYEPFEDVMMGNILFKNNIHPTKLKYGITTWQG